MRIYVFSDTHGHIEAMQKVIQKDPGADMILHAGDHYSDALRLRTWMQEVLPQPIPLHAVVGNCDFYLSEPAEEIIQADGLRILLTHGHRYHVKNNLERIYYRALEAQVDTVVFGHTHVETIERYDQILFFNPGSISMPRRGKPGYGILEITDSGVVKPKLLYI